ncbi:MAG: peptidase M20 [Phycisphaeraceae bacterium]|nr:MAG: peptidase M20 [Phycisphaeraceae bacterium]
MREAELIQLRRDIHAHPELSGHEHRTHDTIAAYVRRFAPTQVLTHLGPSGVKGTGLAAVYDSGAPGKTVLVRAELDALPILEQNDFAHRSVNRGVMHACGHDGHMTTLAALAPRLEARPPERGRVVLLFQPAEETGAGAADVLADERWPRIEPDAAIALHNLPAHPLGQVVLRAGVFSCASVGMHVRLMGRTAHAAHPETGLSPAPAIAELIDRLPELPAEALPGRFGLISITHARAGEDDVFGTTPAEGILNCTVRTDTDDDRALLAERAEALAREVAADDGLVCQVSWHDDFAAAVCDGPTVNVIRDCAQELGLDILDRPEPFRWSEDFGRFTIGRPGVLFGLGSGPDQPQLHNPDYDFPDELIQTGADLFERAVHRLLA